VLGKIQTLDSDPSDFASGLGRDQFFGFPLVVSSVTALTEPNSTQAAGVLYSSRPKLSIQSTLMNTTDSSTTSGFDDIGDGTTWATEASLQYKSAGLPAGMNAGFLYAFDGDFRDISGRLIVPGSGGAGERKSDSWAAFWTSWQYLKADGDTSAPIRAGDGRPDHVGYGIFTRFGIADPDTNPIEWSASIGLGGRGVGSRDQDTYGLGYVYNALREPDTIDFGVLESYSGGLEGFYGIALTPAALLTFDAQWLQAAVDDVDDSLVLGFRLNVVL
jgi:porin